MSTLLEIGHLEATQPETSKHAVRELIGLPEIRLLLNPEVCLWQPDYSFPELRRRRRLPFHETIQVQPLASETATPAGKELHAIGLSISLEGVAFQHNYRLDSSVVEARFQRDQETVGTVRVELTWCRYTGPGAYCSGGRFVAL